MPRPAFTAAAAVKRAISLVGDRSHGYELGTGDYRPDATSDLPWTTRERDGAIGSDCAGFAISWCYGIRRHRPGLNHHSSGDFDVQDDLNCNSAIGDADTDRDLFERVMTPAPGVLLVYPTIHLAGHPLPWVGHVCIVTGVARCTEWDPAAPRYDLLDVAQCCGGDGRKPAVIASDGSIWLGHDHTWPLPQHRTVMLRVTP